MTKPAVTAAIPLHAFISRKRRPGYVISLGMIALAVACAFFASYLAPFDPLQVDLRSVNSPPGVDGHLLGTDASGRDILSRLMFGAQTSLLGPLVAILIAASLGIMVGAAAAWYGGWLDSVLSRVTDFLFAFPGLLAAVFTVALFGPGILAPAIGIAIAYTPVIARITRTVIAQERGKLYVQADGVLGFPPLRTLVRTVMPNALPVVFSQCILSFGYALVDLAALSFLGLGVQAPTPDWGVMLNESASSMLQGAWWVMAAPAIVIAGVVVAFNIVGETLISRKQEN